MPRVTTRIGEGDVSANTFFQCPSPTRARKPVEGKTKTLATARFPPCRFLFSKCTVRSAMEPAVDHHNSVFYGVAHTAFATSGNAIAPRAAAVSPKGAWPPASTTTALYFLDKEVTVPQRPTCSASAIQRQQSCLVNWCTPSVLPRIGE
jgi:hypothetical protein